MTKKFPKLILVLIIVVAFVIVNQAKKPASQKQSVVVVDRQESLVGGKLSFSNENNNCCVVGQPVTIGLIANSSGQPINGFDGVILFDKSVLSFKSSSVDNDKFDIITVSNSKGMSVAGILKSSETQPIVVSDKVVSLVFIPLKEGQVSLTYKFTPGRTDDSNIVMADSTDILKSVSNLNFEITKY